MDSFSQYNFQHQKRGYALIICNENFKNKELTKRKGQLADLKAFKDTLEQHFKFDVDLKVDQTASQTQTLMEAAARKDYTDSDCFLFILSTHGRFEGTLKPGAVPAIYDVVEATDRQLPLPMLLDNFKASRCPSLAGKPKLFFIQACRGYDVADSLYTLSLKDSGEVTGRAVVKHHPVNPDNPHLYDLPYRVPIYKDFLLAYATPPGYFAFKTPTGSPFLQRLREVLDEYGQTTDIMDCLTRVNKRMAEEYEAYCPKKNPGLHQSKAMSWVASMLTKQLIFTPASQGS